jgi:transposase-like protein
MTDHLAPPPAQLFSADDAAAAIGVDPATLRDWVRRGLLTRYGSPRRALYDVNELVAAKDAQKPRRRGVTRRQFRASPNILDIGTTLPASQPGV